MHKVYLRIYFILAGLEGFFVLWKIISKPSEMADAVILGLTPERIVLFSIVLILAMIFTSLGVISWTKPNLFRKIHNFLVGISKGRKSIYVVTASLIVLFLVSIELLQFSIVSGDYIYYAYLIRIMPVIIWISLICAQSLIAIFLLRHDSDWFAVLKEANLPHVILVLFVLVTIWVVLSRVNLGISNRVIAKGIFHYPGTPLIGSQVIVVFVIASGFLIIRNLMIRFASQSKFTLALQSNLSLGILIWLLAILTWMSVPLESNWFAEAPRPPNFEFYPNSDAVYYDKFAQNLIIGEGFGDPLVRRPVYVLFLAVAHLVGGLGYEEIIWLQILVLGIIPVVIFGVTSSLHNRFSGFFVALLVILRERNALLLADSITVVHAKLLMSDLPAMLGAALFLWVIILWLKKPEKNNSFALLAGGVLGVFMLIRSELAAMIPFVGLGSLFVLGRQLKNWIKGIALVIAGCILIISPWIWRNWQALGTPFLDVPGDHLDFIEFGNQSYIENVATRSSETKVRLSMIGPARIPGRTISQSVEVGFVENLVNHVVNGAVQSLIYLPMTSRMTHTFADHFQNLTIEKFLRSCCSPENYVRQLPYWWSDWDGKLAPQSTLSMVYALLFLSFGFVAVSRKSGARALVPLLAWLAHLFIYALIRRSGGRFILEVDWVILMFYGIGIVEFATFFYRKFQVEGLTSAKFDTAKPYRLPHIASLAIGLLIVGVSLPVAEKVFPERYDQKWLDSRLESIQASAGLLAPLKDSGLTIETFINDGDILYGRALYPRFFRAGDGMAGDDGKFEFDYARIEIYLIGDTHQWYILPFETQPVWFPHGSDVLIFQCPSIAESSSNLAFAVFDPVGENSEIYWHRDLTEIVDCFDSPSNN